MNQLLGNSVDFVGRGWSISRSLIHAGLRDGSRVKGGSGGVQQEGGKLKGTFLGVRQIDGNKMQNVAGLGVLLSSRPTDPYNREHGVSIKKRNRVGNGGAGHQG